MKRSNIWRLVNALRAPLRPKIEGASAASRHAGTVTLGGWAFSLDAPVTSNVWRLVNALRGPVRLKIEGPPAASRHAGTVTLGGWAFSLDAPLIRVEALLDGVPLGSLDHGKARADVARHLGRSDAAASGYGGVASLAGVPPGPHTLTVRATDRRGRTAKVTRAIFIERDVAVQPLKLHEPMIRVEQVTWSRHVLDVAGWALCPASRSPRLARFFVDEQLVGEAPIDRFRPDVGRRFPQYATAVRSGFHLRQPFTPLCEPIRADGRYQLVVELVDATGYRCRLDTVYPFVADFTVSDNAALWTEFSAILKEFADRMEREATVLDWHATSGLAEVFPQQMIFSPLTDADAAVLPYLDRSIDIVILRADAGGERLAEARRVAAVLVLQLGRVDTPQVPAGNATGRVPRYYLTADWCQEPTAGDEVASTPLPSVSIVIPVHNQAAYTEACLAQLVATLPAHFTCEIIVVDDASSDDIPALLARWIETESRIRVLRNPHNLGFLHASNRGAEAAIGDVIVFLNNDTLPQSGWLLPLLRVFRDHPDAGAVGGKLLYPDGTLQEAGGVIFADGSGCNFGRHDLAVDAPLYNYLREVDYCSGALLATRRMLFERFGGFDPRFEPAYYEDTDYCFAVREAGYRVYYQPESVVIHVEGGTSGTDLEVGIKRYQVANRAKFVAKWQDALRHQPPPPARFDFAALQRLAVRDDYGTGGDA